MADRIINTTDDLDYVLRHLDTEPSCLDMGWQWHKEQVFRRTGSVPGDYALAGWLLWTTFRRPDTNTGKVGTGRGAEHFVAVGSTESSTVKRCLVGYKAIVEHEVMEMVKYKGLKPFDPHHTIEDLSEAAKLKALRDGDPGND